MARMAVRDSWMRLFRWSTALCWRPYSGPTLRTIRVSRMAKTGAVMRKTTVNLGLSRNAMPKPMASMTGLRTKGRRPALMALSRTVASVVMRVTREAEEK